MLAVQEYLQDNSPEKLKEELGINVYRHPHLPLVGFKYDQIDSPKTHPIVRDCRGLVLEDKTWKVVAKPFKRFFNAGEDLENWNAFDWSDFTCNSKEDGSLILVYYYAGDWHANTSGSFGLGECQFSGKTWQELFWETVGLYDDLLCEELTYIFELCTPYNKVVRSYPEPTVFLLSMFDNATLEELTVADADAEGLILGVRRPEQYHFTSMDEITEFLKGKEETDKTFEGVIIRDSKNERFKIKSETYVALHHLKDNGNIFNPKRLVPLVLAGEKDEVIAYLPEVEPHLLEVEEKVNEEWLGLVNAWRQNWQLKDQKEFALSIRGKTPYTGLLFNLRKQYGDDQSEELLKSYWRDSADLIVKMIYR